jgi:hypothetical protein
MKYMAMSVHSELGSSRGYNNPTRWRWSDLLRWQIAQLLMKYLMAALGLYEA